MKIPKVAKCARFVVGNGRMKPKWTRQFTSTPPGPSSQFWGYLYINGQKAGKGIVIQAVVPDVPNVGDAFARGECTTIDTSETYNFNLKVPGEGMDFSEVGKKVEFWVNDIKCDEVFTMALGQITHTDLHVVLESTGDLPTDLVTLRDDIYFTKTHAELAWNEALLSPQSLKDHIWFAKQSSSESFDLIQKLVANGIPDPKPIPFFVRGKRGQYSANYLSEFITPQNLMVVNAAAAISNLTGDLLIRAAYDIVAPIRYADDDRVWNCADWWQLPHETLNRQCGDCEDTTFTLTSILIAAGFSRDKVRAVLGYVDLSGALYGHAWVEVMRSDGLWWWLETTWDAWRDWNLVPATFTRQLAFTDKDYKEF